MPATAPVRQLDAAPPAARVPVQTAGAHHRWTIEEYDRLGQAGGFQYGDLGPHETRTELLQGVIVEKHAEGSTLDEIRLRWTREMYERLAERGGFEGLRVELIHGQILDKVSPQGSPHSAAVALLQVELATVFAEGAHVRTRLPFRALNDSEPEPDLAVVAGSPRDYASQHPSSALLVVEVSQSSLETDRFLKAQVYAESGIADYWIVNLRDACIEVHRDPQGSAYLSRTTYGVDDVVSPLTRSKASIAVADLLP